MKLWLYLVLFGAGAAGLVFWLTSPQPRGGKRLPGHPPSALRSSPEQESAPHESDPSETEEMPVRIARRRAHLLQDGVESERNFFGEVRAWARADPDAAIAWAQQQPDSDEVRKEALTDACFQIVQSAPKRAVLLAEQFKLDRDAVLQNLSQQWAAKDLPAASQWIAAQADDDQRNALVTGAAYVWAQTAPADAARFIVEQMTPGSARDAAVLMVLHQWAIADATGATTWIKQFPASPLRDQGLAELASAAQRGQGAVP